MALIDCPECGAHISNKANCCPKCGCPSSEFKKDIRIDANTENTGKIDSGLQVNSTENPSIISVPILEESPDTLAEAIASPVNMAQIETGNQFDAKSFKIIGKRKKILLSN